MAIAAIVLSIGVPSFQASIKNNRKLTAINDMRTALALARSTAITRRVRATVCTSSDNATCADEGGWDQGWIIFADPVDPAASVDDGDEILRVHEKISGSGTFTGNGRLANRVSYTAKGMLDRTLGIGGTLTYSDEGEYISKLRISMGGNVLSVSGSDSGS